MMLVIMQRTRKLSFSPIQVLQAALDHAWSETSRPPKDKVTARFTISGINVGSTQERGNESGETSRTLVGY